MATDIRLDRLLVERGFFTSRERAQTHIMAGKVLVDDKRVDKAGTRFSNEVRIRISGSDHPYVSRGGLKLETALRHFPVRVQHRIAMDVGASTGGFTDCLLQQGATVVFAIDVGTGQLDWKLASDPRVIIVDNTNIRYATLENIGTFVDLIVIDVSFISLTKILQNCLSFLVHGGDLIALAKPQFEAGRAKVEKRGVVSDPKTQRGVIEAIQDHALSLNCRYRGTIPSPICGKKSGNREYLVHLIKS